MTNAFLQVSMPLNH